MKESILAYLNGIPELEGAVAITGYDEALSGYCVVFRKNPEPQPIHVLAYNWGKCVDVTKQRIQTECDIEAEEYFVFNVANAYLGPRTPVFVGMTMEEMDFENLVR